MVFHIMVDLPDKIEKDTLYEHGISVETLRDAKRHRGRREEKRRSRADAIIEEQMIENKRSRLE